LLNQTKILTGYLDDVLPSYSDQGHEIQLRGRSKTCDILDCSVLKAKNYDGLKMSLIAKDLIKDFGISVHTQGDEGNGLTEKVNVGDTPGDVISKMALMKGMLVFDNPDGDLVLSDVGSSRIATSIYNKNGETNIVSGGATLSMRDRYSLYRCVAQNVGTNENYGLMSATPKGQVADSNVPRYRPLIVTAEKAANDSFCQKRAVWERAWRAGDAVQLRYSVNGWEAADGQIWAPNMLVAIEDQILGISGTFLISKVSLSIGDGGEMSTLTCVPPEAYSLEPTMPKTNESSKFWTAIEAAGENFEQGF
ncbi:MAG: hypothetical protein ABJN51_10050, partial [Sneathiella sp.]